MKKIFFALATSALMLGGCGQRSENVQASEGVRAAESAPASVRAHVTENEAARTAAACMDWPREHLDQASAIVRNQPDDPASPAPYLYFPEGKSVVVSASGACGSITPTTLISATPMRHLPPHSITGFAGDGFDHIWMLFLMEEDADGNRTFIGVDGTPEANLPFELPEVSNDTELETPPAPVA